MKRRMGWSPSSAGGRFNTAVFACLIAWLLVPVVPTLAADVTIVANFPANKGPGHRKDCPDAAGAVGPKHTVVFDDRAFLVQDKATGKVLQNDTQHDFWLKVQPARTLDLLANDPRILYDPLTGRWFAWVQGLKPPNGYLAVSTTSDPTEPWKGVKMPIRANNLGGRLGFDKNGLYVCVYNGSADWQKAHTCYAIPMTDAIAADGPNLSHLQTFPDLEMDSFPATDLDPKKAADAPAVLFNKAFPGGDKLFMYKITWSGKKASITNATSIAFSKTYGNPSQAVQPAPGDKIRSDPLRRTRGVFAHGGSVFGCNVAQRNNRAGIHWYEVRVSDGALRQEGFVGNPDCDYLVPSLAVDGNGNLGLGCTRMSEKEFPSVYVMMRAANDPPNTMRAPVLAVAGTTYYRAPLVGGAKAIPWGNYSSTCVDPSDPNLIWTCQEYANSKVEREWYTAWAAFRFDGSKK